MSTILKIGQAEQN